MIELPRELARPLRAVFRRCLATPAPREPTLFLKAGPGGLTATLIDAAVPVRFALPGPRPPAEVALPLRALADFGGAGKDAVSLIAEGGEVRAGWGKGGRARSARYPTPQTTTGPSFPPGPDRWHEAGPGLAKALADAASVCAPSEPGRFALHRVLLRGDAGEVAASDGKQLLLQGGFGFPFAGDRLVARCTAFGCPEVASASPVLTGATDSHVFVRCGGWSFALPIDRSGRFPDVGRVVPAPDARCARLDLDPRDAEALAKALPGLPGGDAEFAPVVLDLRRTPAVRGEGGGPADRAGLVLGRSRASDPRAEVRFDRRYLLRALGLGFTRLEVPPSGGPVVCRGPDRAYVWMPLDGPSPPPAAKGKAVRRAPRPPMPAVRRSEPPARASAPSPRPRPERFPPLWELGRRAAALAGLVRECRRRERELLS